MAIKNYTTQVNMHRTISEIEEILWDHGATQISKQSEDGIPSALYFTVPFNDMPINYKLPANWKSVLKILKDDPDVTGKFETKKQAIRVSWRNIKDWIASQMALIETDMVSMDQIFLPFMVDPETDKTVHDRFVEQGPKLLEG